MVKKVTARTRNWMEILGTAYGRPVSTRKEALARKDTPERMRSWFYTPLRPSEVYKEKKVGGMTLKAKLTEKYFEPGRSKYDIYSAPGRTTEYTAEKGGKKVKFSGPLMTPSKWFPSRIISFARRSISGEQQRRDEAERQRNRAQQIREDARHEAELRKPLGDLSFEEAQRIINITSEGYLGLEDFESIEMRRWLRANGPRIKRVYPVFIERLDRAYRRISESGEYEKMGT